MKEETIAAIATPAGEGGIGIIRISGPESKEILGKVFVAANLDIKPRELTYGFIVDPESGETIDEVMACFMPAPATYTREDVAEINCHGGRIPLSKTLSLVLREGARMAEPGEFTKRAFLNGRLDLSQAEAVIDVINSKTEASLDAAIAQLEGKFSFEISGIRSALTDILVDVAVNIDYPDEDIEELTYNKLVERLGSVSEEIKALLESSKSGKILRDGFSVVIVGRPNVGKSSLMNAILRESRAIVTEIPGTTRDTIEEFANISGIPVRLTDTAGIRETEDPVEKIGIERSRSSLDDADLALLLIDGSEGISKEDIDLKSILPDGLPAIVVFNKEDKGLSLTEGDMRDFSKPLPYMVISLKDESGIKAVEDAIFNASGYSEAADDTKSSLKASKSGSIVTNVRHQAMLQAADKSIEDAIKAARNRSPLELIEIDISSAYENLGFITGDSVREDVIDQVFSRFCLGK
ncbi:MAG: tRNA uridine-5-carboxymethylaminomethyl(34) synthesis GTPase MnmE [Firmicutes bacterium]|nr:tRNA uridine-5-carboxymethylaminomethyl(34) synthesis GTPase MnmE [Bacillota bacterium]